MILMVDIGIEDLKDKIFDYYRNNMLSNDDLLLALDNFVNVSEADKRSIYKKCLYEANNLSDEDRAKIDTFAQNDYQTLEEFAKECDIIINKEKNRN